MAENKEIKSKRDRQIERLRKKYPEKKFEDDDEIYGTIFDDYDQFEHELSGYKDREKTLSNMFAADERSAQFLNDWRNGEDPVVGLVRTFGIEIKDVLDDPEMQDKIAEANKEYVERVAKSKQLDEEYDKNMEVTLETLRQFQSDRQMSDEQIDAVMDFLLGIVKDGVMGKFSAETLDMACKAVNHDSDVANASEEGKVAGLNSKVVEQLRKSNKGDGMQPLGGSNNSPRRQADEDDDIFAQAALAK